MRTLRLNCRCARSPENCEKKSVARVSLCQSMVFVFPRYIVRSCITRIRPVGRNEISLSRRMCITITCSVDPATSLMCRHCISVIIIIARYQLFGIGVFHFVVRDNSLPNVHLSRRPFIKNFRPPPSCFHKSRINDDKTYGKTYSIASSSNLFSRISS